MAATIIYEIVGAVAFATSKTEMPLSASTATRALALLLVASLSSVGAVIALRQPTKKEAKTAVTTLMPGLTSRLSVRTVLYQATMIAYQNNGRVRVSPRSRPFSFATPPSKPGSFFNSCRN